MKHVLAHLLRFRKGILSGALVLALAAGTFAAGPSLAGGPKTVVELFTSQGCSSCPPADAFLGELTERDDIIALTLAVDYWDYLGWKDTFASRAHTKRQSDYARRRGDSQIYTPQMVINGRTHAVGSRRNSVLRAIAADKAAQERSWVPVSLKSGKKAIMVSAADYKGEGTPPEATIWLLLSSHKERVEIKRGENRGETIDYYNVVRQMVPIGTWNGKAVEVKLPKSDLMAGYDGCTALLQVNGAGEILGAAHLSETMGEHTN